MGRDPTHHHCDNLAPLGPVPAPPTGPRSSLGVPPTSLGVPPPCPGASLLLPFLEVYQQQQETVNGWGKIAGELLNDLARLCHNQGLLLRQNVDAMLPQDRLQGLNDGCTKPVPRLLLHRHATSRTSTLPSTVLLLRGLDSPTRCCCHALVVHFGVAHVLDGVCGVWLCVLWIWGVEGLELES